MKVDENCKLFVQMFDLAHTKNGAEPSRAIVPV